MEKCVNCEADVSTNFCSECGQQMGRKPLSWRYLSSEISDKWVGLDNKFARTVSGLVRAPERVVRAYLQGNSVRYIGPLGLLVVMTALLMLVFEFSGIEVNQYLSDTQSQITPSPQSGNERQQYVQQSAMAWISKNFRIVTWILMPFFAAGTWLIYRKKGVSYLEAMVSATYLQANTLWVSIFFLLIYAFTGLVLSSWQFLISVVYYVWALHRIYPAPTRARGFLKGLASYVIGYSMFLLVFVAAGTVIGLLLR